MLIERIIAIAFLAFGGLMIVTNAAIAILRFTRGRQSSMILIAGGAAAAIGLYILPNSSLHRWFWIPLFLDVGCIPMIIAFLIRSNLEKRPLR